MRDVILAGELGRMFGRRHRFAVKSPAEAMRALIANFPEIEKVIRDLSARGMEYLVFNGRENVNEKELQRGGSGKIVIAPVIAGAKRGGLLQTIIGVALIVTGILVSPFNPAVGAILINAGIALTLGGIVQLLTPVPKTGGQEGDENKPNNTFDGPVNTTAQGYPVPVCYGEMIVGSAVISAGIETEQFSTQELEEGESPFAPATPTIGIFNRYVTPTRTPGSIRTSK